MSRLHENRDIQRAISRGDIATLDQLSQSGRWPVIKDYWKAARAGKLNVLLWGIEKGALNFNDIEQMTQIANIAASFGQIEIVNWLAERGILPNDISPVSRYNMTIEQINNIFLSLLEWMKANHRLPGRVTISDIQRDLISNEDFTITDWLESNGIGLDYDIVDVNDMWHEAVNHQKMKSIAWLEDRKIYPTYIKIDEGVLEELYANNNLAFIDRIKSFAQSLGIPLEYFPSDLLMLAINSQDIPTLEWLKRHGILPLEDDADYAKKLGKDIAVTWMERQGIKAYEY